MGCGSAPRTTGAPLLAPATAMQAGGLQRVPRWLWAPGRQGHLSSVGGRQQGRGAGTDVVRVPTPPRRGLSNALEQALVALQDTRKPRVTGPRLGQEVAGHTQVPPERLVLGHSEQLLRFPHRRPARPQS